MAATIIDLIREQNLALLKQVEQNPAILENFDNNCQVMDEKGERKDCLSDKDFGEKLEVLLTIYKNRNPEIFNKLCNVAKKFWLEVPELDELRKLMTAQIKKKKDLSHTALISRLFTPDQEALSKEISIALAQLDSLYTPLMPESINKTLSRLYKEMLFIAANTLKPLPTTLDDVIALYDKHHAELRAEIESALYPSSAAGEACSVESILLRIEGHGLTTLGAYIEKCYPDLQKSIDRQNFIKAAVVQSYLGMCFQYINKKLGFELAGNIRQDILQYLINVIPGHLMRAIFTHTNSTDLRNEVIRNAISRLELILEEHSNALKNKRQALGGLVRDKRKYKAIQEKQESKERNMPVCLYAIEKLKEGPSFIDKLSSSFKSKESDSSDEAIAEWVTETEELINKIETLQKDIDNLKRTIGPCASGASASIPQHSAPARITPAIQINTSTVSAPPSTFRQYHSTESPMRAGGQPTRGSFFTKRQRPQEDSISASPLLENEAPVSADSANSVSEAVVSSSSSAANPVESVEARNALGYSFLASGRSSGASSVGTESRKERDALGYSFLTSSSSSDSTNTGTESEEPKRALGPGSPQ